MSKAAIWPLLTNHTDLLTSNNRKQKKLGEYRKLMLGIGLGIAAAGVGLGLGLIGYSGLQGMSRQPEAIGKLQVAMLIGLAFVELVFLLTVFVGLGAAK